MVFFAYPVLTLLLTFIVAPTAQAKSMPMMPVTIIGTGCGGAVCIYYSLSKLLPFGPSPSIRVFQTNMLVALAGSELITLFAIFVGNDPVGPWPFAIFSIALQLVLILPKLLRYSPPT